MRYPALPLVLGIVTLAGPGVARAQTCAGVLALPLALDSPVRAARPPEPISVSAMFRVEVTFAARRGVEFRTDAQPVIPLDSMRARPDRYDVRRVEVDLHGSVRPADTLSVRTRCGYDLIRFAVTRTNGDVPMVVDVYNVPPHLPLRLDAPLVVRPGRRLRLDLGGSAGTLLERGPYPYHLIPAEAFEEVD